MFRTADKHLAGDRHERALLKVRSLADLGSIRRKCIERLCGPLLLFQSSRLAARLRG